MTTLIFPRGQNMTDVVIPAPDPAPAPQPDPAPAPPPVSTPPPVVVVPPSGEPVAISHAVVALIVSIANLVGYVRGWAPETFGLVNAAVAALTVVLGVVTRQATTPMGKIKALAKAIPQLASAFDLKD